MNYYRRYMGDYMRDTMHLSILEHGAYTLLLDATYAMEKPLPADYEALNRMCRAMTAPERTAVKSVADQFFPVNGDGLRHNPRASREIGTAQSTIAKQRESGVNSAAKRWSTDGSTHGLTDRSSIQPPTTNHQEKTKALSGKPDVAPEILDHLNATCGTSYKPVEANLRPIRARLSEYGADALRGVIESKAREWRGTDMAKYLRPETLFNASKCGSYVGQLNGSNPKMAVNF